MEAVDVRSNMKQFKCCVVIATYNNNKTLPKVLDGVLNFTSNIIVVNDGSTDSTKDILERYSEVDTIHLPENKGKGNALKIGFDRAVEKGFYFAITLDSDGQHFPTDIPLFIEELAKNKGNDMLLIGDRQMDEADVLARSRKGNRVSTYWVKAVTGLDLNDSQSGFRLYPVKALSPIRFFRSTKKFEFEVEVIVKAHWADIEVRNIPINILYDQTERVSHFRPFMDITRIVILIIWFLLVKLFYIIPRNLIRRLKKKGIKRFFLEDFLQNDDPPQKKALSIALGVFIGLSPLWGFHSVIVIFLAILFKLNKVIAFAFSNISLPPFIPFVLLLSLQVGNLVLGEDVHYTKDEIIANFDIVSHLETYFVGSITLSVTASIFFGLVGYAILSFSRNKKIVANG